MTSGHADSLIRGAAAALALLCAAAAPAAAQLRAADSLWTVGRFAEARQAYEGALAAAPSSVRANYRLAILASWDNRLDSALVLIRAARREDPVDPDLRFTEAQVLAWASRFDESIAAWDSLLTVAPERRDAELMRGKTLAWAGRYVAADRAYAAMLERDARDIEALTGRAQAAAWADRLAAADTLYRAALAVDSTAFEPRIGLARVTSWRGDPMAALREVRRARTADSTNRDAQRLERELRAQVRPSIVANVQWSRDSDRNVNWWQTLTTAWLVRPQLRLFATGLLGQSSDPTRSADRSSGEFGATRSIGRTSITGAIGARRLATSFGGDRTPVTARATLATRLRGASLGVGWSRTPFDETAALVGSGLTLNAVDASAEVPLAKDLGVSVGTGTTFFSDGNTRIAGIAAVTQTIARTWTIGILGRAFGYETRGVGYFSPSRFLLGEVRAGYNGLAGPLSVRTSAGLGLQAISGVPSQSAWHAEARLGRSWSAANRIELFAGAGRNAANSAVGAFEFYTAGLSLSLGL